MTGPSLATARLRLRRPEASDADWITAEIAVPEVQRNLTAPPHPYRRAHAEAWLANADGAEEAWIVTDGAGPLGVCSLHRHADADAAELGYWLRRAAWGQGLMTEAAAAVIGTHFAAGHGRLISGYITDNPASGRVLTKLGFAPTHEIRRLCNFRGAEVPIQRMELTRARWQSLRAAAQ